jgi:undecaprenyl-diphosphatase
LTEFLPVSSTGHLVIARELLGLQVEYGLLVDAVLHLATALAVFLYFRADFIRLLVSLWRWIRHNDIHVRDRNLILALILGTLPAVPLGIIFEDYISGAVRSVEVVAFALIAGSLLFVFAEYVGKKNILEEVKLRTGLRIGFFQALALIPGMSRSGMAISAGLIFGLTREEAARFAFMLSFPIILGAGGLSLLRLSSDGILAELGFSILGAAAAAFVTGWAAIHYLLKYLRHHTLGVFVVYRLALAAVLLFFVV